MSPEEHAAHLYPADAEEAVLGAALLWSGFDGLGRVASEIATEDFYLPRHRTIHRAIVRLYAEGCEEVTPLLLLQTAQEEAKGEPSTEISRQVTQADLSDLMGNGATPGSLQRQMNVVTEAATGRRLRDVAQWVESTLATPGPSTVSETLEEAQAMLVSLDLPQAVPMPEDVREFLAQPAEYDWLVPGLLERHDRLIVTAPEGFGKSTLLRQMSVQIAAGIHPFTGRSMDAHRVLIIDLENSRVQTRRKLKPLVAKVGGLLKDGMLRVECRTSGLDLTSRPDRRWLAGIIAKAKPDVLWIGPLYKMMDDDPSDERTAKVVSTTLDDLRSRHGITLLMEAHSPHGKELRPYGASLWKRWPEFGYGLRPAAKGKPYHADVEPWRGPRDEREWPARLKRGGDWPWSPVWAEEEG